MTRKRSARAAKSASANASATSKERERACPKCGHSVPVRFSPHVCTHAVGMSVSRKESEIFLALVGSKRATLIQSRMSPEDARDFALEILRMCDEAFGKSARQGVARAQVLGELAQRGPFYVWSVAHAFELIDRRLTFLTGDYGGRVASARTFEDAVATLEELYKQDQWQLRSGCLHASRERFRHLSVCLDCASVTPSEQGIVNLLAEWRDPSALEARAILAQWVGTAEAPKEHRLLAPALAFLLARAGAAPHTLVLVEGSPGSGRFA